MQPRLTVVEPVVAVLDGAVVALSAPVWVPWPLPSGWSFGGLAHTALDQSDAGKEAGVSTAASWLGVDPFGEPAEMLLVCEEAGSGVGAGFAGLDVSYPGPEVGVGPPHARFTVNGHDVPLWEVPAAADRGVYAGAAAGRWLWVVVHPAEASPLVVAPLRLVDARLLGAELATLPLGELSPRLMLA